MISKFALAAVLSVAVLFGAASFAVADDQPTAGALAVELPRVVPAGATPCQRSSQGKRVGQFDIDVVRCQAYLMQQKAGQDAANIAALTADLALAMADLQSARATLRAREEDWGTYSAPLWKPAAEPAAPPPATLK